MPNSPRGLRRCAVALLVIALPRYVCPRGLRPGFVPQPAPFEGSHVARRIQRFPRPSQDNASFFKPAVQDGDTYVFGLVRACASAILIVVLTVGGSIAKAKAEKASLGGSNEQRIVSVIDVAGEAATLLRSQDSVSNVLSDLIEIEKGAKKTEKALEKLEMEAAKSVLDVANNASEQVEKKLNELKKETAKVVPKVASGSKSGSAESVRTDDSLSKISKGFKILKKEATESIKAVAEGKGRLEKAALRSLRSLSDVFDRLQEDIYSESWVTLATYPKYIRSFFPLFTYYTDGVYPQDEDEPSESVNAQLRSALEYEVESIRVGTSRMQDAVDRKNVRDSEEAFAKMSLAYDRYLKAGNLYMSYDPVVSTEIFFKYIDDQQLQYTRRSIRLPVVRDEILVIEGPDKGKEGQVLWIVQNEDEKSVTAVVKLAANPELGPMGRAPGAKEVKIYPYTWIACVKSDKLTLFDDFVAATLAAVFSCALTCPIDTLKVRQQAGLPPIPEEGLFGLFAGLPSNLGQYAVPGGIFLAGSHALTDYGAALLPFVDSNNPDLKLLLLVPAGILANTITLPLRQPFEEMNKLVMTGACKGEAEAAKKMFIDREWKDTLFVTSTGVIIALTRGVPFGALQVSTYEFFKDKLVGPWEAAGLPIALEAFVWGALAGAVTGLLTNPPDVIMTRSVASVEGSGGRGQGEFNVGAILATIVETSGNIISKEGIGAFASGAESRTVYLAIESCLWFAAYEWLCSNIESFKSL